MVETYIPRFYKDLEEHCQLNKALILYGPRQVGKTTLLKHYLKKTRYKYRLDSGDNIITQQTLGSNDFKAIQDYVEGYELIAIDEAQKIPNIGQCLKIMVDQIPNIRIIATGSSSFELSGQVGEPLTGRKMRLTLYPLAQLELAEIYNINELKTQLEDWIVYGGYPEIVMSKTIQGKRERITEIAESYLLKDILELDKIKNSKKLIDLLRLLAFQIGQEVSLTELGQKLMLDAKTIARYLDLLEQSFVIYNLRGFSRNLRNEITKKSKYYFYDNGIRNALIANFNPVGLRDDIGALWENFLLIERLKKQAYFRIYANNYFWRTWEQKEIDFIEEREGKLFAYEFKWGSQTAKPLKAWMDAYKNSSFTVINKENYQRFIIDEEA